MVIWGNRKIAAVVLAAIPLLILVGLLIRYHVEVPYQDEWSLVPLFEKSFEGRLGWRDLFAQHVDHRLVIPRLLFLGQAHCTGWSLSAGVAMNLLFGAGIFMVAALQMRRSLREMGRGASIAWIPVLSMAVFALHQANNWVWPWQLIFFLETFLVILGLTVLCRPALTPTAFLLSLACGILATLTHGAGLLYWPVGGWVLWKRDRLGWKERPARFWIWAAVGAGWIVSYLLFHRTLYPAPFSGGGWVSVWLFVPYVLTWIGNAALFQRAEWTGLVGGMGLILFGVLCRTPRGLDRRLLLPYQACALYAISVALLIAVGRAGMPGGQAISPRYVTLAMIFWIALLCILHLERRRWLWGGIALLIFWSSVQGAGIFPQRFRRLMPARAELVRLQDDVLLRRLHPRPEIVRERTPILRKYRLSLFRNDDNVGP